MQIKTGPHSGADDYHLPTMIPKVFDPERYESPKNRRMRCRGPPDLRPIPESRGSRRDHLPPIFRRHKCHSGSAIEPRLARRSRKPALKKRSDLAELTRSDQRSGVGYSNTDLRGVGVGRACYDARFQGGPKGGVAFTTTSAAPGAISRSDTSRLDTCLIWNRSPSSSRVSASCKLPVVPGAQPRVGATTLGRACRRS